MTVSSFASLSLNPLLVTVSVSRTSPLIGFVRSRRAFAVSVLASGQQQVADHFARSGRRPEPGGFRSVAANAQQTGVPVIDGCLSWFDCELEDVLPGGDHEILVGRVAAAGGRAGEPLVYWAGGYRALQADKPAFDRLADAADGLSVALLVLDVGVAEMLDAQRSIEPVLAGLAAAHGTPKLGPTGAADRRVRRGGRRTRPLQRVVPGHARPDRRRGRQPGAVCDPDQPAPGPGPALPRTGQPGDGTGRGRRSPGAAGRPATGQRR